MFVVEVVTPRGVYQTMEVDSCTLPTEDGQRTMLANHMATVLPIDIGIMYTRSGQETIRYVVSNGLFTFENNHAKLIVQSIEREDAIDFERAERARERAEVRLHQLDKEMIDMRRAEVALKRSLARLRIKQ